MKKLNAIRHDNIIKLKKLEELQTRYDQLVKDTEEAVKTDAGESETAVVRANLKIKLLIHFFDFLIFFSFFKETSSFGEQIKQS